MLRLLGVGKRQLGECLFWIIVFSLRPFFATSSGDDVEVKVIIHDDQHTLQCESSSDVTWYYREQQNETLKTIKELGDTSYIVMGSNLHITNIRPEHEGFYSCGQQTEYHFLVLGMPRFSGCFDVSPGQPCVPEGIQSFAEGENLRFNISVSYITGGASGQLQDIRLVRLEKDSILANCLDSDLTSCLVNPNAPQATMDRLAFRRDESNPWFDIQINITNAMADDSGEYTMLLEAEDVSAPGVVTRSTSIVNVVVTTPLPVSPTSSILSPFLSSSNSLTTHATGIVGMSQPSVTTTSSSVQIQASQSSVVSVVESLSVAEPSPTTVTDGSGIQEAVLVTIVLGSSFLILVVLGFAVLIVVVFKKKDKEKVEPNLKVVELKTSTTQQFLYDDQTTVTTYLAEDKSFSSFSYVGKGLISGDDFSLPRCSLILVDDHRNSDAVTV